MEAARRSFDGTELLKRADLAGSKRNAAVAVRHQGDAYSINGISPTTSLGAALGAGLNIPIVSGLSFTAGADMVLYQLDVKFPPDLRRNPGSLESGFQRDALVHVGLAWGWR